MQVVRRPFAATLVLVAAAVVAGSAPLASQEHHGGHAVSEDAGLTLRHDSAASEFTVRVGPLRLPAGAGHAEVAQAPDLHLAVPVDGWLVSYRPRLVDGAGERIPGRLLHHVAFWSEERPDFLCPSKDEHVFGAGGEMNVWPALPGVGYPVREGDRIRVNTMFHNPTDTAYGEVYLEVDVGYRTRSGTAGPLAAVYPVWLDVQECGASSYDLAPGTNVDSAIFVMPYDGRLLGLGGHLHDYGRSLRVEDLTRDREVVSLQARLDEEGRILSMPVVPFVATGGYELSEGDSLRVIARYENPTGRLLEAGAMGIAVGYFRPAAPEALAELRRSPAASASDTIGDPPPRQLGEIHFPTSAGPEAQAWFDRGVLLLHSFIYGDAAKAFGKARAIEPDFALAHWGEAMTYNHPLWREQDSTAARAVLDSLAPTPEARRARAPTEREKLYLDAVETLYYGEGSKARRDTLYARAVETLVERFPEDREARAFRALSLLGLSGGDRHVPTYMRGGAMALRLMDEHPEHPGAMHYAIHSFDDPTHAPLGLEAARRYGDVAPGAHHARHMTSHIFLALGLWDDVVAANEAAARAVADELGAAAGELYPCGHYAEWLAYGYLQQARPEAARMLVGRCLELARADSASWWSVARMRTILLADDPSVPAVIATADPGAHDIRESGRSFALLGDGLAALQREDVAAAREALDGLRELAEASDDPAWHRVRAEVLEASVLRAEGSLEAALEPARTAAELAAEQPVPFGPPSSFKPPRELEGEILLELNRPEEAYAAFRRALERTPRRARSLLGLARAAEAAGRETEARRAREELRAVWRYAEDDAPWSAVAEVTRETEISREEEDRGEER